VFGLRNVLVMAQVALSLVTLVGAGLFLRSLQNAQRTDPGFETATSSSALSTSGPRVYSAKRRPTSSAAFSSACARCRR
jgi:hypothetical protein